jgi:dienelactone hydrolase
VLPGTLAVPVGAGPWPAVVLVHGSGPEDRDETVGANKPFRDLAWGLASLGVAVLRYEKRTKQYATKLAGKVLELTLQEETIDDALDAAGRLRSAEGIDARRVFVLGHSLGGLAIPRIGKGDAKIAGLIILAGSTRPLEDIIVEQLDYLASLDPAAAAAGASRLAELRAEARKVKQLTAADLSGTNLFFGGSARYWLDLRAYDAAATARGLKQPLLILQGQRDYQATEADFEGWQRALGECHNATFKLYPELNHLFMAGEGKSRPSEYERSGHVAEGVIADIAAWIGER